LFEFAFIFILNFFAILLLFLIFTTNLVIAREIRSTLILRHIHVTGVSFGISNGVGVERKLLWNVTTCRVEYRAYMI
jgi:hypothetical protein